jgi:DNA-binding transcriptional LysR family regulator
MESMELRHLRTIDAVARHGSFTRAAEELYLAQSAISQQIRRLESELGIEVFRRNSRSVEVTEEGRLVLAHARRVLAEVDDLHNQLEELTGLLKGIVRIGGTYPFGGYDLYGVLADFRAEHGGVDIHMLEETQERMLEMIRTDELDCAFAPVDPDAIGDEFAATLLWEEEFVVAVGADCHLVGEPCVTFEQLASEDLIAYRDNSALQRRLESGFTRRGLEPRTAFVCTEMNAVRGLASKGLGAAVIPRSVAEQEGAPIELIPFGPEPLTWPIALVWRATRRQPPAAKAFLALALERAEHTGAAEPAAELAA